MINVEVERTGNENNLSLLRRFSKRVQTAGILPRLRSIRYSSRSISEIVKRKKTLKYLRHRATLAELVKLGKIPENGRNGRRKK
ncbi:hypothetical protein EPN83_00230 [Patescibacteria group bacterium]|nr:MAG: hypothetical protein EPN83_00230 [Patescibacteria group bacterium]